MARRSSQAYVCLRCDDPALQISGAGYDGWIVLLRDHFDTEDQAWPHEKVRLEHAARRQLKWLEERGIDLGLTRLRASASILIDPPVEDERVWCLEHFRETYDYCSCDDVLLRRVAAFQDAIRAAPPSSDCGLGLTRGAVDQLRRAHG